MTFSAGVPTVWLGAAAITWRERKLRFSTLAAARHRRLGLSAGDDADRFEDDYGIEVRACLGHDRDEPGRHRRAAQGASMRDAEPAALRAVKAKQGRAFPASISRSSMPRARSCPGTATAFGDLMVRGPWIASAYFKRAPGSALQRRLVPDRRCRDHRRRRLHQDHRPLQGRDQERRRMDQLDRAREHRGRPSRRRRGGGDRRASIRNGASGRCSSCMKRAARR